MSGRLRCGHCLRPQAACICEWITPVVHRTEVLILQHPLETDNPKGTARLLHLSLPGSKLLTGEVLDLAELQPSENCRHNILLYPDRPSDRSSGWPAPPELPPVLLQDASQLRLVVLDGTWQKSRRMLHLNPALQQLPRLSLQDLPPSNYRIRRARQAGQLSTLEAVCAALAQLEGDHGQFRPLLDAFDGFVNRQMAYATPRADL
ncbi:MAG: tRNA-uridine aminocarboxypropyltransferase [Polaromonas sp.]|nr:tRNA-uridine aminocarboxypropyltransferase [Polaromonas sp.]